MDKNPIILKECVLEREAIVKGDFEAYELAEIFNAFAGHQEAVFHIEADGIQYELTARALAFVLTGLVVLAETFDKDDEVYDLLSGNGNVIN